MPIILTGNKGCVDDERNFRLCASELDAADPLKDFRNCFAGLQEGLIYLDGNSLGPLPSSTPELLQQTITEKWGKGLVRSWNNDWYDLPQRLGDLLSPLIGAEKGEVCFADSVTVNLFKLAAAALKTKPGRSRIITDTLNFPSDYYTLEGLTGMLGKGYEIVRITSDDDMTIPTERILESINSDTALVTLSHVVFKSGFMHDLEKICSKAREQGALTLIDLSHSVGSVPVELLSWGVDMAVGCSYKYLNGGPGAPAFLYVRQGLQDSLQPQLAGWFGAKNPFHFDPHYEPAQGIARFIVGTPPILSLQAVEPGIRLLLQAEMNQVRAKSVQLTNLLLDLFDAILEPIGFSLGSPRDPAIRGSHLSFKHEEAFRINKAMINPPEGKLAVIPDFRTPDNLRLGIAPLFLSHDDIVSAAFRIREIVMEREFQSFDNESDIVT